MKKIIYFLSMLFITQSTIADDCVNQFWDGYLVNYFSYKLLDGDSVNTVTEDVIRISQYDLNSKAAQGAIEVLDKRIKTPNYSWKSDYKASIKSMCNGGGSKSGVGAFDPCENNIGGQSAC